MATRSRSDNSSAAGQQLSLFSEITYAELVDNSGGRSSDG
jgi:hypothetical protein